MIASARWKLPRRTHLSRGPPGVGSLFTGFRLWPRIAVRLASDEVAEAVEAGRQLLPAQFES